MNSDHDYSAVLLGPAPVPFTITGGEISLDEGAAPHVQGTLELGAVPEAVLTALDPRAGARVKVTADAVFPWGTQHRVFDLGVRSRPIIHDETGRKSIRLASDEALTQDHRTLVDDAGAAGMAGSVRSICNYVLGKVPSLLVNVEPNPRALASGSTAPYGSRWGWVRVFSGGGEAAPGLSTYAFFNSTETATGVGRGVDSYGNMDAANPGTAGEWVGGSTVFPGEVITISRYCATNIAQPNGFIIMVRFHDGAGHWVGGMSAADFQGARPSVTVTVPPGATRYCVSVRLNNGAAVSVTPSSWMGMTGVQTERSATLGPFKDPVLTNATDAALTSPDPDALIWRAGDSAMEFLHPLVQAAGLRLVCDEARVWTLRDEEYTAGGETLSIRHGVNLIEGSDTITLDDGLWYDARATRYTWPDAAGATQTEVDTFTLNNPPRRVSLVEVRSPYPGPGRSEYAVRRAQGRGREVTATVVADWRTKAEQTAQIVLEHAPLLVGETSRVVFDLSRDEMTITTRTVDMPDSAWEVLLTGETWFDSPVGESWIEEVV